MVYYFVKLFYKYKLGFIFDNVWVGLDLGHPTSEVSLVVTGNSANPLFGNYLLFKVWNNIYKMEFVKNLITNNINN